MSYDGSDKLLVEKMAVRLEDEERLKPFLDKWHLVPGEPRQEGLEDALAQSLACAVFLGSNGLGHWQNEEVRSALDSRIRDEAFRVIPVLLPQSDPENPATLPAFLRRRTWVDFRAGLSDDVAFASLVAGIRGRPPGRTPPPGLQKEKRETVEIVLSGTSQGLEWEKIIGLLQQGSEDLKLTIERIKKGSVRVFINSSEEGADRIEALRRTGNLQSLADRTVLAVKRNSTESILPILLMVVFYGLAVYLAPNNPLNYVVAGVFAVNVINFLVFTQNPSQIPLRHIIPKMLSGLIFGLFTWVPFSFLAFYLLRIIPAFSGLPQRLLAFGVGFILPLAFLMVTTRATRLVRLPSPFIRSAVQNLYLLVEATLLYPSKIVSREERLAVYSIQYEKGIAGKEAIDYLYATCVDDIIAKRLRCISSSQLKNNATQLRHVNNATIKIHLLMGHFGYTALNQKLDSLIAEINKGSSEKSLLKAE